MQRSSYGYDLFRCDRPIKLRGEGVLLYVKKELQAVKVEGIGDFPEQVWCKICVGSDYDLLIGVGHLQSRPLARTTIVS